MKIELSLKDCRFIVQGLDYLQDDLREELEYSEIAENEIADLSSDISYINTLRNIIMGGFDE